MMISISRAQATLDASKHTWFSQQEIKSLNEMQHFITHNVWSPIVWKGGQRKGVHFLYSDFLALDFDDGKWTIADAVEWLNEAEFSYVIGTTKSHQIAKGDKPACDRFRVLIPWHERITDSKTYYQNAQRITKMVPCDEKCKDTGRLFFPCNTIAAVKTDGFPILWRPYEKPVYSQAYKDQGLIPPWIARRIREGAIEGNRNNTCFVIAAGLSSNGFSESECIEAVMRSPIDLPEKEKIHAAKSGYRHGRNSC